MRARALLIVLPVILMGANDPDGCASGNGMRYECECWTGNSAGFVVGEPSPCADDDEDALSQAVEECSNEVGESCDCDCSTGGKSCDDE